MGKTEGIWEMSVLSAQILCEPKTLLKNKVYFFSEGQRKYKNKTKMLGLSSGERGGDTTTGNTGGEAGI